MIRAKKTVVVTYDVLQCIGVLAVAAQINSVKKDAVQVEFRDAKNLEGASKPAASVSYNGYV